MSLYANLLKKKDPTAPAPATISSEPVKYSFKKAEDEAKDVQKAPDAALRFQPSIKRPQVTAQAKTKPRPALPASAAALSQDERRSSGPAASAPRVGVDDWIDEEADDYYVTEYQRHKQQQREREKDAKKRNKKKRHAADTKEVDWNAPYDPEQPTQLALYKGSLEELDAKYEWKQRLHAHERKNKTREVEEQSEAMPAPADSKFRAFAPPSSYDFAPPSQQDDDDEYSPSIPTTAPTLQDEDDSYEPPPAAPAYLPQNPLPPHGYNVPPTHIQQIPALPFPPQLPPPGMPFPPGPWQLPPGAPPPPLPPPGMAFPPPPPPPPGMPALSSAHFLPAQAQTTSTMSPLPPQPSIVDSPAGRAPPLQSTSVISRAPVRFAQPSSTPDEDTGEEQQRHGGLGSSSAPTEPPSEVPSDAEDEPRSSRPGQKGFAKRLLQKYGWKEGQGLGAEGTGITTILQHQTQKRKKKSDNEGGGWAGPNVGRIVGGKKRKVEGEQDGDNWSIVARFDGMLAGMDIDQEVEHRDLMQKIGEKMATYGHVERLYIHRAAVAKEPVFVKFTSALSAYRAVQASNEQDFMGNGCVVRSGFWDEDKFDKGEYE